MRNDTSTRFRAHVRASNLICSARETDRAARCRRILIISQTAEHDEGTSRRLHGLRLQPVILGTRLREGN